MRDGASRSFIFSCGIRRFALIASQKSHDTFCFCLYRAIISGRELVCAKKSSRLISKRIGRFLIATPRGRRMYPENRLNRWLITRRCAVPQAKAAVSEKPGFSLLSISIYTSMYRRRAEEPTTVNLQSRGRTAPTSLYTSKRKTVSRNVHRRRYLLD
jgi:hypothetical protein